MKLIKSNAKDIRMITISDIGLTGSINHEQKVVHCK
jgi:hypothetical protein